MAQKTLQKLCSGAMLGWRSVLAGVSAWFFLPGKDIYARKGTHTQESGTTSKPSQLAVQDRD